MIRLTMKRLHAIEEALIFRLAGEIEDGDDAIATEDYDAALLWVNEEIARRAAAVPAWRPPVLVGVYLSI